MKLTVNCTISLKPIKCSVFLTQYSLFRRNLICVHYLAEMLLEVLKQMKRKCWDTGL